MKIWMLLSRFSHGGLERVQVNLVQAMQTRGMTARLVAGQVVPGAERMLPHGLRIEEIASRGKLFFPVGLVRAIRREYPDIVFTTASDVACLMLVLRALFFRRLRVVVVQHLSLSGPRRGARGLKRAKLEVLRLLMKIILPCADRVVAVSHALAVDMYRELSLKNGAISVVHNPIVTPDFPALIREEISWPWMDRDVPTIIYVGRISAEKRLDLLLDAFQALVTEMPLRLLVVGTGPQLTWMEDEIQARRLGGLCQLIGFHVNPLPWIKASNLLVLPSDYEGFGNVLVEAMACGTQIVSTDCPDGPSELLDHGKYGQLVPRGDASALAVAIRRSLSGECLFPVEILRRRADEFGLERAVDAYSCIVKAAR